MPLAKEHKSFFINLHQIKIWSGRIKKVCSSREMNYDLFYSVNNFNVSVVKSEGQGIACKMEGLTQDCKEN